MKILRYHMLFIILALSVSGTLPAQETHSRFMTSVYPDAARVHDSILAMKVPLLEVSETYHHRQFPAMVDNTRNEYWPGMKDQFMFYSCQQYAGVGYVFDYEINRLRNQPGWYYENSYPTHYTWNFMNQGDRYTGVDFLQSFNVIRQQGHMTMPDYGSDTATSVLGWISGYDKYYRGMFNHLKQVYAIKINSAAGINTLRNYLYDHLDGSPTGGIACFTTSSETLYNLYVLPAGTPEAGQHAILEWKSNPVHGLTVVGYNDSIRYDVNHDGEYTRDIDITGDGIVDARDWETGGFKIANSYGNWWADTGFVYALYRSFALNYEEGGIWNNRVYLVQADTAYRPLLTLKVNLNYNARNLIRIMAGVSEDTLDQMPRHVIDFPIFNFQGGAHAMQGNDTIPEETSIEFGLDVTQLLNFIPSGHTARYFLMVEERDPDQIGQGKIMHASFINYMNNPLEIPVNGEDKVISDNNITLVSAVAAFQKSNVRIATTSLPPYTSGQPVPVQMEASGGIPPYDWSFVEEYIKKPSATPEPLITGTSIQVHYETRSFASVALPFSFPFFGHRFDSIYVNYFGFIAFEPQNLPAPFTTDEMGMLRMFPLIVPSFSQQYTYQSNKNDGIWFEADTTHAIIRWKVSVSPYVTSSTDDFAVILYPDGRIEYCYGTMENQGFVHSFYEGVSKGDELNYDIQTRWNANEIAGKSFVFYPPVVPEGLILSKSGLLSVDLPDSSIIYGLHIRVADAGKISDSKVFMLSSGLEIVHELICGDDARLKSSQQASLKLVLTNNGSQPIQNLALKLIPADSLLQFTENEYNVANLNPGQTLTIPAAFGFSLRQPLPDEFPVMMTLRAQSGARSWNKALVFRVAAPELVVELPYVVDGYNDRLDPGEVADLLVQIKNTGSLMAQNLQMKLVFPGPFITILSAPLVSIEQLDAFSSIAYQYQIKASQIALPGSNLPMQIILSDSTGLIQTFDYNLPVGTKPVALVSLSTSQTSVLAMATALDSLHVGYDTLFSLPNDYHRYASIFMILGTAGAGYHSLSETECATLVEYLLQGGNLYIESYHMWYYHPKTFLLDMFKYTSKLTPLYYYSDVKGTTGTFTDSMSYVYTIPYTYAVFKFEPVAPAYSTLINTDSPAKNLEIVYDGSNYKTIGTILNFSTLTGGLPPSTQTTLMQRYLEFFNLNIDGPFPLFHAGTTIVCQHQAVTFTDDSFDNITLRNWEFPGGTPAVSNDMNPVVRYDTSGKFDVKLTVSDGISTQTILKQKYIQVDQCAGGYEHPAASSLFRIFPNPATGLVTIEINRNISGSCDIMLFDLAGRKLMEMQQPIPAGHQMIMNLSGIGKGIYFIRLKAHSLTSTLKLVLN